LGSLPQSVRDWLRLQQLRSALPQRDGLLVEMFPPGSVRRVLDRREYRPFRALGGVTEPVRLIVLLQALGCGARLGGRLPAAPIWAFGASHSLVLLELTCAEHKPFSRATGRARA
jgi:hypothetical protein